MCRADSVLTRCRASLHRIAELGSVARSVRRATCQRRSDCISNTRPSWRYQQLGQRSERSNAIATQFTQAASGGQLDALLVAIRWRNDRVRDNGRGGVLGCLEQSVSRLGLGRGERTLTFARPQAVDQPSAGICNEAVDPFKAKLDRRQPSLRLVGSRCHGVSSPGASDASYSSWAASSMASTVGVMTPAVVLLSTILRTSAALA